MRISKVGTDLIKEFEQCKLHAYLDPARIPTIGWGNTYYQDGTRVKIGDVISQSRADELFFLTVNRFSDRVSFLLTKEIPQNKFDALVSFTYNIGINAFSKSRILRRINTDPSDPLIRREFLKWTRAGGKVLNGLIRRREAEASLYFKI